MSLPVDTSKLKVAGTDPNPMLGHESQEQLVSRDGQRPVSASSGGRRAPAPAHHRDQSADHLGTILSALTVDPALRLPDWSFSRWWRLLQYPDANDRPRASTVHFAHIRDNALGHAPVRALVDWAGARCRSDPIAGAASALVAIHLAQIEAGDLPDAVVLARRVTFAVDTAHGPRSSPLRRTALVWDPDQLSAVDPDCAVDENPALPGVVRSLLRLAGHAPTEAFAARVEDAVVQAGDWWSRHALPVPSSIDGPALPGVMPAQRLRDAERISAYVSDKELLHLVAGPHPGRYRPGQVAWRRGLAFWTAACLRDGALRRPSPEALRWWRSQLASARFEATPRVARAS